ncbi:hypothetical protein BVI2075_960007 [Burkholderia vietnamiensis]|nr:hypothetical protein BVI2075_960007 [Burkholderia vietnamiensis]
MQVLRWVAYSCDREKLLWLPEFTSGPHGTARSSPFGQLLEITTGGCRSVVADGEGQLPATSSRPASYASRHLSVRLLSFNGRPTHEIRRRSMP